MSTTEAGRLATFGKPASTGQPGISLQAVIEAARRLDELSCARVVGNIASTVHAAQKGGQPLGTLTPDAVRVLPDGGVTLVTGTASSRYAAPEKLRGSTGDRRTDVFALGVVLWETLAHERLFDGANDDAIKQAILGHAFRPPSECNANVPAELDAICKKALALDPSDRYQSAKVMAAEIEAVLDDAGYPESNDQIAKYVAKALAPDPAATLKQPVLPASPPPSKPGPLPNTHRDTLPPPPFKPSHPGPEPVIAGSAQPPDEPKPPQASQHGSQPLPPISEPPSKPVALPPGSPLKSAKTEILGSLSLVAAKPPAVATTVVGSNVGPNASNASNASNAPPDMPAPAAALSPIAPAAGAAPSFAPPEMPASMAAITTPSSAPSLAPDKAATQDKPSIANAETITTPQLPAHLAIPSGPPQLSMPPGMTVAPATPGAPLQSTDHARHELVIDPHAAPVEVVALHSTEKVAGTGREARDVLSGWGWATGAVDAIDDDDHDEAARAGRKRLILAMGGAIAVVLAIAIIALAFSGSKEPSDRDAQPSAAKSSATAPATPPMAPEPAAAPPTGPVNPAAEPPKPEPAAVPPSPEPVNAEPPKAEPPVTEPLKPEPPGTEPPKTTAAEPPKAAVAAPPKAAVAEPPKAEPPKAEPPKVAAAIKAPAPAKTESPITESPKKPDSKKPTDKAGKRPPTDKLAKPATKAPPPDKAAPPDKAVPPDKAAPVDPYGSSADKPKADPAAAYKTGLQQFARGDTTGALATLRTSLSSNPSFPPTWRGLGLVYEKLGNKELARSAFKHYLELAPAAGDGDQIRERMERLGP